MKIIKQTSLCLVAVAFLLSCNSNSNKAATTHQDTTVQASRDTTASSVEELGEISFAEKEFNFGSIPEGKIVNHTFEFTNTGQAPLILSQVNASCGCTTPEYSKAPILPGQKGLISVAFNSQGQVGKQQKIVTVMSNASNGITTVQLKGEVLTK